MDPDRSLLNNPTDWLKSKRFCENMLYPVVAYVWQNKLKSKEVPAISFLFSLVDRSRLRPRLALSLAILCLTEEGRCPEKLKPPLMEGLTKSRCVDDHIFLKTDIQFTNVQNRYWQLSVRRKSQKLIKLFFSKIRAGTRQSA